MGAKGLAELPNTLTPDVSSFLCCQLEFLDVGGRGQQREHHTSSKFGKTLTSHLIPGCSRANWSQLAPQFDSYVVYWDSLVDGQESGSQLDNKWWIVKRADFFTLLTWYKPGSLKHRLWGLLCRGHEGHVLTALEKSELSNTQTFFFLQQKKLTPVPW